MDVFIEILYIAHVNDKRTKLKVRWWNKGQCDKPYSHEIVETIIVKSDNYTDWSEIARQI